MILSKLVLGGANFGQTYGIGRNKIKLEEINKILSYLKKKNKKIIIDSSPNYKNCEKILKTLFIAIKKKQRKIFMPFFYMTNLSYLILKD